MIAETDGADSTVLPRCRRVAENHDSIQIGTNREIRVRLCHQERSKGPSSSLRHPADVVLIILLISQHVTCVHKANIMKLGDGLFLNTCRAVAKEYEGSGITFDDMIVDNTSMQLVARPQQFDVMVMPNLFVSPSVLLSTHLPLGCTLADSIVAQVRIYRLQHRSCVGRRTRNRSRSQHWTCTSLSLPSHSLSPHVDSESAPHRQLRRLTNDLRIGIRFVRAGMSTRRQGYRRKGRRQPRRYGSVECYDAPTSRVRPVSHFRIQEADSSITDWINTRIRSQLPSTRSSLTEKYERPTWEENLTLPIVSHFPLLNPLRRLMRRIRSHPRYHQGPRLDTHYPYTLLSFYVLAEIKTCPSHFP